MKELPKRITILMADDDAEDRQLAKEAFEEARIANRLRFVESGTELLDYLKRRGKYRDLAGSPRPGLILLDPYMPNKGGLEALQEIKADPSLWDISIVIMTTSSAEEKTLRSNGLSATSFITKPVTLAGLAKVIKNLSKFRIRFIELSGEGTEYHTNRQISRSSAGDAG